MVHRMCWRLRELNGVRWLSQMSGPHSGTFTEDVKKALRFGTKTSAMSAASTMSFEAEAVPGPLEM
jgi:hypothetical protein